MPNPFSSAYIDDYLDPTSTLHADPIRTREEAEQIAESLFKVFRDPADDLNLVGTVEDLADALWENFTAAALAECDCLYCRERRASRVHL